MINTYLWEILVPRKYNNGKPVSTKHHKNWDQKVQRIINNNGITILQPTIKGEWISTEGKIYIDSTIPVRIVCTREEINKICDMTAKHYNQLAVMTYKISDEVIIKNYD